MRRIHGLSKQTWLVLGAFAAVTVARCSSNMGAAQDSSQAGPGSMLQEQDLTQVLEESDIFKRDGDRVYALNRVRGLYVARLTDLDKPVLEARLPLPAEPREMWLHQATALIVVASKNPTGWWSTPSVDVAPLANYRGSALVTANVADPTAPTMQAMLPLGGDCFDGRLRGTVLYLACRGFGAADAYSGTYSFEPAQLYSIDVSDPAAPAIIQNVPLGGGQDHHLAVTEDFIVVAEVDLYQNSTNLTLVDITATDGTLARRGSIAVPGAVPDRFALDVRGQVLRVASGPLTGNGTAHVSTISIGDPSAPTQMARADLAVDERLMSARFDGDRGYLVTFRNVDPLFVFDLTDESNLHLMGKLEVSGWLDFMVPMGNRLLAMGHEDVPVGEPNMFGFRMNRRTLAVSLIDVTGGSPQLLDRKVLDGAWGTIPAERDDYNKLFRVFADPGLVLFPYRTFTRWGSQASAGLLVLDWVNDHLDLRADLNDIGMVERGFLWDVQNLVTLSLQSLQVFDLSTPGAVKLRSKLDLARQVTGFAMLDNNLVVDVSGDLGSGPAMLTAHDAHVMDDDAVISRISVDAPAGYVLGQGHLAYFVGVNHSTPYVVNEYFGVEGSDTAIGTHITVVDYAEPHNPVVVGQLTMPEEVAFWDPDASWYGMRRQGVTSSVVMAMPGVLVLKVPQRWAWKGCSDDGSPPRVYVVDLRQPSTPQVHGPWRLSTEGGGEMTADGNGHVLLAGYTGVQALDVTDPAAPMLGDVMLANETILAADATSGNVVGILYVPTDNNYRTRADLVAWNVSSGKPLEAARAQGSGTSEWFSAVVHGDNLVTVGPAQVQLWKIADGNITLRSNAPRSFEPYTAQAVAVSEDGVFVRDASRLFLYVVDINGLLQRKATYPLAGRTDGAHAGSGVITAATGYHGLVRTGMTP